MGLPFSAPLPRLPNGANRPTERYTSHNSGGLTVYHLCLFLKPSLFVPQQPCSVRLRNPPTPRLSEPSSGLPRDGTGVDPETIEIRFTCPGPPVSGRTCTSPGNLHTGPPLLLGPQGGRHTPDRRTLRPGPQGRGSVVPSLGSRVEQVSLERGRGVVESRADTPAGTLSRCVTLTIQKDVPRPQTLSG